jgi:hypothetical protein
MRPPQGGFLRFRWEAAIPRNGSGAYSLPVPPFVPNTVISSSAVNSDFSDIATAITGSLARDGQGGMTGPLLAADGTLGAPGIAFVSEPDTGIRLSAADTMSLVAGGVDVLAITGTGAAFQSGINVNIAGALSVSGAANFTGTFQLAGVALLSWARGHIAGLTLGNNAGDAVNDIDIAVGSATADDQTALLVLASALTKRLDAAWVVGTNQGGLDTGSIADTTYHVWLIRRPDTGVVDVLFSTSATSPTMPTNYTQKRRIGSIIRASGAIVTFVQIGDTFTRIAEAIDRNNTAAVASGLLALSVPAGIVVMPIIRLSCGVGVSTTFSIGLGSAVVGSANVQALILSTGAGDSAASQDNIAPPIFATNTSRQIYFRQTNSVGTPTASILATNGWVDRRGQDA